MGTSGQAGKQFIRRGIAVDLAFGAGDVIDLDDAATIGCIGEFEAEDLGVFPRLLYAGFCGQADLLRLHHCQRIVATVIEQVIGPLVLAAADFPACDDDAAVGEGALFTDAMWCGTPAGLNQLGCDVFAAGVCFRHRPIAHCLPLGFYLLWLPDCVGISGAFYRWAPSAAIVRSGSFSETLKRGE